MRLDKYLANMGVGTRTEVKTLIKKGRIRVYQDICKKAETNIDENSDLVFLDEEQINFVDKEYIMFHKPKGCVSATEDIVDKTVLDYIASPIKKQLFPVGRLDKDTEGLLLITNDGELAHRLLSPKQHVKKIYYAKIEGKVTQEDVEAFAKGLDLGDFETLPAELKVFVSDDVSEIEVGIYEGKFHQVKRMFEKVGKKVVYLKRLSMGDLILDPQLGIGEYRALTEEELESLKKNQ